MLSERSTVAISPECCEGGGSAWRRATERVDQQSNRRYQKFACVGIALIGALDDPLQLRPATVMGTGIAGRQICLFAMVHRHAMAIGHRTIIVQSMAVCRSSHQRTAQIATCRQRLNADEKQQHCYEEELLRHIQYSDSPTDFDDARRIFVLKQPKRTSTSILMVAPLALGLQNAGCVR